MIAILRKRRSIRKYADKKIGKAAIAVLKESLLRSPSSRDIKPWEFVFVSDPQTLHKLSAAKEHGSEFLKNSGLGIVVCADETKSDVWIEDCSIASTIAHCTAHTLGLGSCWIQIRNRRHSEKITSEKFIKKILGIPSHIRVEAIISIGIPAESKKPLGKRKLLYSKIHENTY